MALVLNEEQRFLADTARDFLTAKAPVTEFRKLRDEHDSIGYSNALWQSMSELGWAGITLPEQHGGLNFGYLGLGAVLEETGRTLTASPLFSTSVVGASTILLGANELQKESILPRIANGSLTLALALEESHHHDPSSIATKAIANGERFVINGRKTFVLDGHSADQLIVVARTGGEHQKSRDGISLFLVDPAADGICIDRTSLVDSRNSANIMLNDVCVPAANAIGEIGGAWPVLEAVLDRARIAIAAEMMGCALESFERTVAYLKERVQFGAPIGSFQALQHRAAHMQSEIELCRSVLLQALSTVDDAPDQLPMMSSLAKAKLNELVKLITNEAVQMHGGIGVTDELDIGLFLKRARVTMQIYGDTAFHKDRYATLCGY
jgi:alkylation response protein AidB-like acyl-CoA dehydrogenase